MPARYEPGYYAAPGSVAGQSPMVSRQAGGAAHQASPNGAPLMYPEGAGTSPGWGHAGAPEGGLGPATMAPASASVAGSRPTASFGRLYGLLSQPVRYASQAAHYPDAGLGQDAFPTLLPAESMGGVGLTPGAMGVAGSSYAPPAGAGAGAGVTAGIPVVSPATPYVSLERPAEALASPLAEDFYTELASDPRLPGEQQGLLGELRGIVEHAVANDPDALTASDHPVRRCLSAISSLVWTEGEAAVAPCGLDVKGLVQRLADPGLASPALYAEVAEELDAVVADQKQRVESATAAVVSDAEHQQQVLSKRRSTEGVKKPAPVPEALEPWVEQARELPIGCRLLQSRPRQSDAVLTLAFIGEDFNPFVLVDAMGERAASMTLQEVALLLCRGRLRRLDVNEGPVEQALLGVVDRADQRLHAALSVRAENGLWSEVGLLGALDSLMPPLPARTETGNEARAASARLARWRRRDPETHAPLGWSEIMPEVEAALPTGTSLVQMDDGDLLAYAEPELAATASWSEAIKAVGALPALADSAVPLAVAETEFRPGKDRPAAVVERLAADLAGVAMDPLTTVDEQALLEAMEGRGHFTLVTDATPVRDPDGAIVAWALQARLLERLNAGQLNGGFSIEVARRYDRWVLETAIERLAEDLGDDTTPLLIPLSDSAVADPELMAEIGQQLLESGVPPARCLFSVGLRNASQRALLRDMVANLQGYGSAVAVRYRHGVGFTASELKAASATCLQLPDWLAETEGAGNERTLLLQSLVELCRFIGLRSLAVAATGSRIEETLRELGVDWIQEAEQSGDTTLQLRLPQPPVTTPDPNDRTQPMQFLAPPVKAVDLDSAQQFRL